MKFSIKDFLSKFNQIHKKMRIFSHLLKIFTENFILCAVAQIIFLIYFIYRVYDVSFSINQNINKHFFTFFLWILSIFSLTIYTADVFILLLFSPLINFLHFMTISIADVFTSLISSPFINFVHFLANYIHRLCFHFLDVFTTYKFCSFPGWLSLLLMFSPLLIFLFVGFI